MKGIYAGGFILTVADQKTSFEDEYGMIWECENCDINGGVFKTSIMDQWTDSPPSEVWAKYLAWLKPKDDTASKHIVKCTKPVNDCHIGIDCEWCEHNMAKRANR